MSIDHTRKDLERRWKDVYQDELPDLARQKHPSQKKWPVQLDHCFARIILDAVIGRSEDYSSGTGPAAVKASPDPTPWTSKLKSPAIRHVESTDLAKCINLGEAIAAGKVDLVQLDEESLKHRGKLSKVNHSSLKRKMNAKDDQDGSALKNLKISSPKSDIRAAFGAIVPPPLAPARVDVELSNLIKGSSLTGFRKRVLLALCQVPRGSVSSYLAISDFLDSSPRAVGNALRNNPFAPRAPCHRIVAADLSIGGFGGSWGTQGVHFKEKVDLLKQEGVKVDLKGKVKGTIWSGFL